MISKQDERARVKGFVRLMRDSGSLNRSGMGRVGGNRPMPLELVNDIKRASTNVGINKLQLFSADSG